MPDIQLVQSAKNNSILLANYMVDHATISGQYFAYSEQERMLYAYNGKIYEPFEGIDLDRFFHEFMVRFQITESWKNGRLSEISRALKVNGAIPRVEMNNEGNKICFKNGVLNLDTQEFVPHSPSFYFSTMVEADYLPELGAAPEVFMEVLEKIFWKIRRTTNDGEPDYPTINMIKRIGGALLFPKNKLRQLYIFLGGGANGKSVLFNTFSMFFPSDRVTYMTLSDLSNKGFDRSGLVNSWLNISTETKGESINSEEIKKLVYGEGIVLRRKGLPDTTLMPKTKCVVASNTRPYFNDTSYGLERRLTVVSCNSRFVPQEMYEKTLNPEGNGIFLAEDDDVLMAKLEAEKSVILNFFLDGLRELIDLNWQLPKSESVSKAKEDYLKDNDTVGSWLRENFEFNPESNTPVIDILAEYREWYRDNVSSKPLNFAVNTMGARIREIFRLEPTRYVRDKAKLTAYQLTHKYEPIFDEPGHDEIIFGDKI